MVTMLLLGGAAAAAAALFLGKSEEGVTDVEAIPAEAIQAAQEKIGVTPIAAPANPSQIGGGKTGTKRIPASQWTAQESVAMRIGRPTNPEIAVAQMRAQAAARRAMSK
jgi:hypothetical protein